MSARIDIFPGLPEKEYKYEVRITEEALQSLDDEFMLTHIGSKSNLINFYLDEMINLEECLSTLERLEKLAGPAGSICIFTTGSNFKNLMNLIGTRNTTNHYEMHIDDNDIRNIIDVNGIIGNLNFDRISCDCYFSDRYLMNFNLEDFITLCKIPECKFDRERVIALRGVIEKSWLELCSSLYSIYQLSDFEKTEMVLDFIQHDIILSTNIKDNQTRTQMAGLLLDNYLAQVNCRVVDGVYLPTGSPEIWLVTRQNGNYYGHSLLRNYHFSNLEDKGYADGIIRLEDNHRYRDDFQLDIPSYATLDEGDYLNLISLVYAKKGRFPAVSSLLTQNYYNNANREVPVPLVYVKDNLGNRCK